ncbi:hypothetical protein AB5I39_00215 [Sphingomonas sp. MMS24-J45]|uniref:hypothetical protein n=1 Tax=Sphingomonas sp. MMS24-J45 TaxID=3238806 RepID=UPI00384ADE5F
MRPYRVAGLPLGRRRTALVSSIAAVLLVAPVAGHAQLATAGQTESPGSCELHIWPADGMLAVRQRALDSRGSSGVLEGILKRTQQATADRRDAQVATALKEKVAVPLSPPQQIATLKQLPLNASLGIAAYRPIVHEVPLTSREIRTITTRYDPAPTARCYADLVVDDLVYSREYARGRKLKAFVRYRDFGATDRPIRSFATLVETKLEIFSLDPLVTTDAANAELVNAFARNLQTFAAIVAKQTPHPQSSITGKE